MLPKALLSQIWSDSNGMTILYHLLACLREGYTSLCEYGGMNEVEFVVKIAHIKVTKSDSVLFLGAQLLAGCARPA